MLGLWIGIFIVSLVVLVKGADWLISGAEKIGLSLGMSPFIVGVTIVGAGTSLPELISSLAAAMRGVTEVVAANVIGSNIANILLIVGISAIISRQLTVKKSLIDLDLPLLATSTVLLLGVSWDATITFGESLLLLVGYAAYLHYTFTHTETDVLDDDRQPIASLKKAETSNKAIKPKLSWKDFGFLILGLLCLILGAKYLIDALINLSEILNIATGAIAITAVAVGTSLPELLVSAKAAMNKKPDVALGNIFGSNVFNSLVVIGIPGLFKTLNIDSQTFAIGLPALIIATLLFVITGISRRVHIWEGMFFVLIYVLFLAKLFVWF
jgi:cation:H+ antiporter